MVVLYRVLDDIGLAPGFAREVVEAWDKWEGRTSAPLRLQQLMLNLRIDVNKLYRIGVWPQEKPKPKEYRDTRLREYSRDLPKAQNGTTGETGGLWLL